MYVGGNPKVSKGERRKAGIQWIQPPKAVSDPEFRQTTGGTHGSANRADCLPRGKPFGAPAGAPPMPWRGQTRRIWHKRKACNPHGGLMYFGGDPKGVQGGERKATLLASIRDNSAVSNFPRWGLTRRLRRELGLAVPRGTHTFLSVAKEKCAKESQRHGDSGKKPFIAHFDDGARYVARSGVGQLTPTIVRARSSPFSAAKMGGPFSLRCLSPLCFGAVGVGHTYPLQGGMLRRELYIFATQKASVKSKSRWPSLRAMRPVAEWRSMPYKPQGAIPAPRAARPVAERR